MNREENTVLQFLKSNYSGEINHEPDGNIPPDFLINNEIAVEVRRLNENVELDGKLIGTESLHFKLWKKLRSITKKLNSKYFNDSYNYSVIVSFSYKRPLIPDKIFLKSLEMSIIENIDGFSDLEDIQINENFSFRLFKSNILKNEYLHIGSSSDRDTGGFVVSNIYKNLQRIIQDKEKKVKLYQKKYKYWWLVLVDMIDGRLEKHDIEQLLSAPSIETRFDKVIILTGEKRETPIHYK